MSKIERDPVQNKNQNPIRRGLVAAAAAAALLAACSDGGSATAEPGVVCMPKGAQEFTFDAATTGKNDAVHAIKGSGNGEGDPCWDEAVELVNSAVESETGYSVPQQGMTIEIPAELEPIRLDDK